MAVDAIAGTNGTQQILDDAGTGTYLGVAFTGVATLGGMQSGGAISTAALRGQLWLTSGSRLATGVGLVGLGLNAADDGALWLRTLQGDCAAFGEWAALQQLGAADGPLPFGDVLAAGVLVRRRGTPDALFIMPDGVRKRVLPDKGTFVGRTFYPADPQLRSKYPHGVQFTVQGYPDFTRYAEMQVRIRMTGNRSADFAAANRAVGFGQSAQDTPAGFTWHHHQDRTTMQLVPEDLHAAVKHTGGVAVIKEKGPLP